MAHGEYAGGQTSQNRLHEIVTYIWKSISSVQLSHLTQSMIERY